MKSVLLHGSGSGKVEGLRLNSHRSQIQIRVNRVERTGVGQGPDCHRVLRRINKMWTYKKLRAAISQERAATRRRIGGPNRELKSGRKRQRESHCARESTAAAVDQVVFGDGDDGGIDEPIQAAVRIDYEFVKADEKAVVIDGEVWEVWNTRPTPVGIVRTRRIESVNAVVTSWIGSLTDGEVQPALLDWHATGGVEL